MSAGTMQVTSKPGMYVVTGVSPLGVQTHFVGKDRRCTCGGGPNCRHVEAVADYLRRGGKRAPECHLAPASETPNPMVPSACPICEGEVRVLDVSGARPLWRCLADSSHYWQWRGELSGVRAFLTGSHPNKVGAFYGQSPKQRSAFLAAARQRLFAGGYTPL